MIDLDHFDVLILACLQQAGKLSNQDLAERVPLSASQCSRRRQRLEEAGIIRAYRAVLDEEAVGIEIGAFVQVVMASHSSENAEDFKRLVRRQPEVLGAFTLTGEADYMLQVATTDLKALARFMNDVLLPHPAVARVQSQIVLEAIKAEGPLPLDHLKERL
ncbi:Lrp/AsnC family transcriptional regulator [Coralliovum pocilloporae]|uniref:Lrp/AsnC family transcriptional regulator n=1 Tax=Coralliovum pocilloporae TaxID=3066369 RepID=UPI003306D6D0